MIKTLSDAQRLMENGAKIEIDREVRYYARTENARYELSHDRTIEAIERELWEKTK